MFGKIKGGSSLTTSFFNIKRNINPTKLFLILVYTSPQRIERFQEKGYEVSNIDVTFICEVPKINQYRAEMEKKLSEILKIELNRINIKATTSEGLGFTGRKEGIACLTTLGLISKC